MFNFFLSAMFGAMLSKHKDNARKVIMKRDYSILQRPQQFSTVFYLLIEFEIETAQWGFSLKIIMICQYCLTTYNSL